MKKLSRYQKFPLQAATSTCLPNLNLGQETTDTIAATAQDAAIHGTAASDTQIHEVTVLNKTYVNIENAHANIRKAVLPVIVLTPMKLTMTRT